MNYTWQKAEQEDGSYFFYDRDLNQGLTGWDRTHTFNLILVYELPFGKDKKWGNDWSPVDRMAFLGGWQFNASQTFQSGIPFDVSYAGAGADRDVGPNRPERERRHHRSMVGRMSTSTRRRSEHSGSPYTRPAPGTFGNMERNSLRGPGYRRTDASMFKRVRDGRHTRPRVPDRGRQPVQQREPRQPGHGDRVAGQRPARMPGRINSTAYVNADLQRNFQFAVRFQF